VRSWEISQKGQQCASLPRPKAVENFGRTRYLLIRLWWMKALHAQPAKHLDAPLGHHRITCCQSIRPVISRVEGTIGHGSCAKVLRPTRLVCKANLNRVLQIEYSEVLTRVAHGKSS
jgi:hypothetical protein